MMVKICGITDREDALAAVEGGAAALGFNFYPNSPRYLTPERAAEIASGLPEDVWKIGVFVNAAPELVLSLAREVPLDVAQLHGDCANPQGIRIWRALPVDADFRESQLDAWPAEAYLLDTPAGAVWGGTGRSFEWSLVAGTRRKIILAGGLDESNVALAIRAVRPWGVDACSRLESSPGKKDHQKMAAFLKAALSVEIL